MMAERKRTSANGAKRQRDKDATELSKMLTDGLPPQNLDAEKAVLGCILRENHCLADLVKILKPESFYAAHHQKIYASMIKMYDDAKPIDAITLAEDLATKGELMDVGGAPTILELIEGTLTAANVLHHAQIVSEKAVLRGLIHASTEILRDAYDMTLPSDELLGQAEKRIFSILEGRGEGDAKPFREILSRAFDRIDQRHKREDGDSGGVFTGFQDLDELTNGWQPSEMIILAARPSMGKTAFALNTVEHAAVDLLKPVLFVSLEMSELELAERLLCSRARVNSHQLRRGRASEEEIRKLIDHSGDLTRAPLFIDDTPGQSMLRISATARRLKLREGLAMIVIDYMQLIEPDDKGVSRVEQIGTISRRIKNLARELHVPVIALSQLNRGVESREGHKPRMSDLRESGSIEQDADVVALLHRPDAFNPEDRPNEAELIIAKQRNGPTGEVRMTFLKDMTRFESYSPEIAAFDDIGDGF